MDVPNNKHKILLFMFIIISVLAFYIAYNSYNFSSEIISSSSPPPPVLPPVVVEKIEEKESNGNEFIEQNKNSNIVKISDFYL